MALRINRSLTALANQTQPVKEALQLQQTQQPEQIRYKHQYPVQEQLHDFSAIHYAPPETLNPYAAASEPPRSLPVLEIVSHLQPESAAIEPESDLPHQPELSEIIPTIRLSDLEDVSYPNPWNPEAFPMEQPFMGSLGSQYSSRQYALYSPHPQQTSQLSLPFTAPEPAQPSPSLVRAAAHNARLAARKTRRKHPHSGQAAA